MKNTTDFIIKEYKINESVLVTYHSLNSLYRQFFSMYPKELKDKVVDLISDLRDELMGEQENDFKSYDIDDYFYERVIYTKDKKENEAVEIV